MAKKKTVLEKYDGIAEFFEVPHLAPCWRIKLSGKSGGLSDIGFKALLERNVGKRIKIEVIETEDEPITK